MTVFGSGVPLGPGRAVQHDDAALQFWYDPLRFHLLRLLDLILKKEKEDGGHVRSTTSHIVVASEVKLAPLLIFMCRRIKQRTWCQRHTCSNLILPYSTQSLDDHTVLHPKL